ncbi:MULTISPECIES: metallophosphoesterase family protein [unclassified Bradyrhizobium]|uniref:metallophosphoesterase family protein n=1 Tax=unclassified Bradyrhizobium TaxID=2631580 RepID=UPI001FF9E8F6|nr:MULTISPECIES: metallophosphoesterase family protein [unclassified Bradyrhizobium]MCK1344455.1 serine/threonine protein phosphatase [Bradyrhizobium sp. CW11]MCK1589535.1 serine/threonine protein phosphatase [Bradyrhizobium sp. 169]
MSKTYAIGDIHGCLDQLERLVELCERDAGEGRSKLVFLGDYIDRGPDSRGVIEFLMDLQRWSHDEIICLRGNHEDLLLAALEGEDAESVWHENGAATTLASYKASTSNDIPFKHIEWIRSLSLFHDDGMRFFVHAGVHPDWPLDQQRRRDLLWIREPFLSSNKTFGRLIVHGHTPIPSGNPHQRTNRLNIDTGAVYGRALTSAIFDTHKPTPVGFLSASHIHD